MRLLSVDEVRERLSCSRGHVYTLITAGKLDRHNIGVTGRATRISEESVERLIAASAEPLHKDAS